MRKLQLKRNNRSIILVCLLGLLLRAFFFAVGASIYFGRENIFVDGDTAAWASSFQNLVDHGTYSVNLDSEYGYFGRMPGYSFFIGLFYLITGSWESAYPVIAVVQTLLDVAAIFICFKIGENIFGTDSRAAYVLAFLYGIYPFIIVWNPVVYSESISIFFMLVSVYYFVSPEKKYGYLLSGLFLALALLNRPQIALLFPVMAGWIVLTYRRQLRTMVTRAFQFTLLFAIVYGAWPLRNYVNHGKLVTTQDLRGFENWNVDVISFMQYIYSVKSEWEPQFTRILKNEPVTFPPDAYKVAGDSLQLAKAVEMSRTCGSGFSYWPAYSGNREQARQADCSAEIAAIFTKLRENQVKHNPMNFYVKVPLSNLKKSLFKFSLNDTGSAAKKAASLLFIFRTLLILAGAAGIILMLRNRKPYAMVVAGYFILLYLALSAGTAPQFRNIEMRYLLPADILLLIPAAYLFAGLLNRWKPGVIVKS